LLGIHCILVSSEGFGCQFHPFSGALVCTAGKVQYMCARSVSSGVNYWKSTPDDTLHEHMIVPSRLYTPVLLRMNEIEIQNI